MQLNLSFPPSFPSNVAWHPPLIRKARTRCDLCRALHDFARLRLTSQCLPSGNYGWRVWTQRGWLPIINLLIYERGPWNAHGQHSWTPWHHWLQHQDYQIQRRIRQRWETQRHRGTADLQCGQMLLLRINGRNSYMNPRQRKRRRCWYVTVPIWKNTGWTDGNKKTPLHFWSEVFKVINTIWQRPKNRIRFAIIANHPVFQFETEFFPSLFFISKNILFAC